MQVVGVCGLAQCGSVPTQFQRGQRLRSQVEVVAGLRQQCECFRRAAHRNQCFAAKDLPAWRKLLFLLPGIQDFDDGFGPRLLEKGVRRFKRGGQRVEFREGRLLHGGAQQVAAAQGGLTRGQSRHGGGLVVFRRFGKQGFRARVATFVQGQQAIHQAFARLRLREPMPGGERQAQQGPQGPQAEPQQAPAGQEDRQRLEYQGRTVPADHHLPGVNRKLFPGQRAQCRQQQPPQQRAEETHRLARRLRCRSWSCCRVEPAIGRS